MKRIIPIIQLYATQIFPLRGTSNKVFQLDNRNLLKNIECLAKLDTILITYPYYPCIQNNNISLLGQRVQNVIGKNTCSKIL